MLNRKRSERAPAHPDTSLIARGTVIQGDVRFSGALHLDGQIVGSVLAEEQGAVFTLSESGHVEGEIRVPHAIINGHVRGDIHAAERLELASEARVAGDVHYRTLEMAAGAQVNGRMSHHSAEATRELPAPTLADAEAVPA
ncbi:protein CcmA, bactofilin family [Dyella jiangningensis]|uniref:bactofilin family protein n=1 Tax=Dyella sp. AtDHG13 TaxID=1938897 RepID=UPI00088B8089|nr:polymer-forming cytoskeletal protein [Dyella sp. AtDHG13]PXV57104.1 cytoskeletal protein CcmA (bactofilin family) [Dyella sp. AtDHG13]SDL41558.1 protein CcmA, bactofilin family [Dyella jiangningensis]